MYAQFVHINQSNEKSIFCLFVCIEELYCESSYVYIFLYLVQQFCNRDMIIVGIYFNLNAECFWNLMHIFEFNEIVFTKIGIFLFKIAIFTASQTNSFNDIDKKIPKFLRHGKKM